MLPASLSGCLGAQVPAEEKGAVSACLAPGGSNRSPDPVVQLAAVQKLTSCCQVVRAGCSMHAGPSWLVQVGLMHLHLLPRSQY